MKTYEEVMTSGDNTPNNVIPEDLTSILIRTINREDLKDLEHPVGPMPPSKALKPELIELFTRWVLGGAPNTAAEAAASSLPGRQCTPASPTPGTLSRPPLPIPA